MESYDYIYAVDPGRFDGEKQQPPINYPVKLDLDGTYDVDSVINLLKKRLLSVRSISITEDGNISFEGIFNLIGGHYEKESITDRTILCDCVCSYCLHTGG